MLGGGGGAVMRGSFEPTYEELKPHLSPFTKLFVHRFEPTYEELKPENHLLLLMCVF